MTWKEVGHWKSGRKEGKMVKRKVETGGKKKPWVLKRCRK
jgi:hypothetical protein